MDGAQHHVFVAPQAERPSNLALECICEDCARLGHSIAEHDYPAVGFSTSSAIPWPPPTQADAMP